MDTRNFEKREEEKGYRITKFAVENLHGEDEWFYISALVGGKKVSFAGELEKLFNPCPASFKFALGNNTPGAFKILLAKICEKNGIDNSLNPSKSAFGFSYYKKDEQRRKEFEEHIDKIILDNKSESFKTRDDLTPSLKDFPDFKDSDLREVLLLRRNRIFEKENISLAEKDLISGEILRAWMSGVDLSKFDGENKIEFINESLKSRVGDERAVNLFDQFYKETKEIYGLNLDESFGEKYKSEFLGDLNYLPPEDIITFFKKEVRELTQKEVESLESAYEEKGLAKKDFVSTQKESLLIKTFGREAPKEFENVDFPEIRSYFEDGSGLLTNIIIKVGEIFFDLSKLAFEALLQLSYSGVKITAEGVRKLVKMTSVQLKTLTFSSVLVAGVLFSAPTTQTITIEGDPQNAPVIQQVEALTEHETNEEILERLGSIGKNQEFSALVEEKKEGEIARISEYTEAYGCKADAKDFVEAAINYDVDVDLLVAIAVADTSCGKHLLTPYNIGNVGNTDSGKRKNYDSWEEGIEGIARTIRKWQTSEKSQWQYIGHLSNGGLNKLSEKPDFINLKSEKRSVYATSQENWDINVRSVLSVLKGDYIDVDWEIPKSYREEVSLIKNIEEVKDTKREIDPSESFSKIPETFVKGGISEYGDFEKILEEAKTNDVANEVYSYFKEKYGEKNAEIWVVLTKKEGGWRMGAKNINDKESSYGAFQINLKVHMPKLRKLSAEELGRETTDKEAMDWFASDLKNQCKVADMIYQARGGSFTAWSVAHKRILANINKGGWKNVGNNVVDFDSLK